MGKCDLIIQSPTWNPQLMFFFLKVRTGLYINSLWWWWMTIPHLPSTIWLVVQTLFVFNHTGTDDDPQLEYCKFLTLPSNLFAAFLGAGSTVVAQSIDSLRMSLQSAKDHRWSWMIGCLQNCTAWILHWLKITWIALMKPSCWILPRKKLCFA